MVYLAQIDATLRKTASRRQFRIAEATGTTAEEIERGADEVEIGRPWEGDVIESDE